MADVVDVSFLSSRRLGCRECRAVFSTWDGFLAHRCSVELDVARLRRKMKSSGKEARS
jgi:hypothetical protein